MKISDFISIFQTEILFKQIPDEEVNCNLYEGIRYLYPGMSAILPSGNVFGSIYAGDYNCYESILPLLADKNRDTLFVFFGAPREAKPEGTEQIKSSVLILTVSEQLFFSRIANLNKLKHLQLSAEQICIDFWDTVIRNKTDKRSETAEKAMLLPHKLNRYMAVFVLRHYNGDADSESEGQSAGEEDERTVNKILLSLSQFFQGMNAFYYRKTREFIVIHTQSDKDRWDGVYPKFTFDYELFSEMLGHYHLHAGLSNSTRAIEHLYTMYYNAKAVLDIAEKMGHTPKYPNIYPHLENSGYQLIDLAFESYKNRLGHNNIVYLTHPAVWNLMLYDFQNHTDLLNVLYSYIVHNCNVSETARDLFFHRNTIQNKLNRIRELTDLDLDDNQLLFNLFLSCNILMYYRDYVSDPLKR